MKVGRPTKYNDDILQKANEYIESCSLDTKKIPTIEGLALELGVDDDQINEWSKKYPEFHASAIKLMRKQKTQLMNDGLYGGTKVSPAMAMFLLKSNHGMIETEKRILTGDKNADPIQVEIIEDIIKDEA